MKVAAGTYHLLGPQQNQTRIDNGNHNLIGDRNPSHKRVKDGTHHLLGPKSNKERLENGTHPSQNPESVEKIRQGALRRVADGTSPFLKNKKTVPCYDRGGNYVRLPQDEFKLLKQERMDDSLREFVAVRSTEGKKRRQKFFPKESE